jgi:nucleoid-associated protein YgaU
MPTPSGFQKACLEIEGRPKIECWFNPKEYSVQKANNWDAKPIVGKDLPTVQFGGGNARELSLDLLFAAAPDSDVAGVTDELFRMMEVLPGTGSAKAKNSARPPTVTFSWGGTRSFLAVAKSLSVQYTMFRPDGIPIRAQAKLTLVQVAPAVGKSAGSPSKESQNPTTRAIGGIGARVIRDGDSLQSIAYSAYGDPTRWRVLAEANGIDDPTRLRRGGALSIPRLEP